MLTLIDLIVVVGASTICALIAFVVVDRKRTAPIAMTDFAPEPISFLFDNGVLHHATQNALTSFALLPGAHVWEDLHDSLVARFPQFPISPTNQSIDNMTLLPQRTDDTGFVTLHWRDNLCWVELSDSSETAVARHDPSQNQHLLQAFSETSPHPAWETLPNGVIGWRNPAYVALVLKCSNDADKEIFESPSEKGSHRVALKMADNRTEWFELSSHETAGALIHHATSVTHLLQAEDAQRTFVQTLAKTFAQLPIGLAIFDRNEQLSIFNPALVDLSGLGPQFLAGQPTLLSFFDALRENRRMPEPKNYNTWRNEIAVMIAAAADGQYHETWTLEDGRTYSVQGRPHPEGAIAFLIEDISAEVTLTRNFRIEVEQYEALLNTDKDALILFSSGGVVTFSNKAYHKMWGQNPEAAFADVTVQDAITVWEEKADGNWIKAADFIKKVGKRTELELTLTSRKGTSIHARLTPLGSDSTLIRFSEVGAAAEMASL